MTITQLFENHHGYIYSYAMKLTGNISDAEDLTQEVFLTALEKLDQVKNHDAIKAWLRSICLNHFLMQRRKKSTSSEISYDALPHKEVIISDLLSQATYHTMVDEIIVSEFIQKVHTVCFLTLVHRMGPTQRIVFSLIDMFHFSIKSVSELMDLSVPAVKSHLNRARLKIDEELLSKCGLLDVNNPCTCKAWQAFVLEREERRASFYEHTISQMSEEERNQSIEKIRKLFADLSDFQPSDTWRQSLTKKLEKLI